MKCLNVLALFLIIIGALNWGLWGFFQFDAVAWIADGNTTALSRLIYGIIGLAGVWSLGFLGRCKALCCGSVCSKCGSEKCSCKDSSGKGSGCCKM